jgi:hypothetical protein
MVMTMFFVLLVLFGASTSGAFTIAPRSNIVRQSSALFDRIRVDDVDFSFDVGQGGVRLAEESVIEIIGTVKHKPGEAQASMKDIKRYLKMTPADVSGAAIIATGVGKEQYSDPGETTEFSITYAPMEAVKDAFNRAGSAMDYDEIHINFLGCKDLQTFEVLQASEHLVLSLDIKTKAKVSFSSLSQNDVPEDVVIVTVVGLKEEQPLDGLAGAKKGVAQGKLYMDQDGKAWTVTEEEIHPALM